MKLGKQVPTSLYVPAALDECQGQVFFLLLLKDTRTRLKQEIVIHEDLSFQRLR